LAMVFWAGIPVGRGVDMGLFGGINSDTLVDSKFQVQASPEHMSGVACMD
jgi:hypothetical protein